MMWILLLVILCICCLCTCSSIMGRRREWTTEEKDTFKKAETERLQSFSSKAKDHVENLDRIIRTYVQCITGVLTRSMSFTDAMKVVVDAKASGDPPKWIFHNRDDVQVANNCLSTYRHAINDNATLPNQ